jgi:uncharacterized OsmC-like protein
VIHYQGKKYQIRDYSIQEFKERKPMKTFKLSGTVTISIYTEVEAETAEEAIDIAEERGIEVENFDSEEQVKDVWVSSEFDGSPSKISVIE